MILGEADARLLTGKILALSRADSCTISIDGSESRHVRFAQNMSTTSGAPGGISVSVESHFGRHSGSATGTELGDAALASLVAGSEKTARLAPENPEFLPPLGKQTYGPGTAFFPATEAATPALLADAILPVLKQAEDKKLLASGFLEAGIAFSALATSNGLFAYDRQTEVLHTITARTGDGTGSGWAGTTLGDYSQLDATGMGQLAMDKAFRSQKPVPLAPGRYTVILEPSAVSDLLSILVGDEFDQRSADEGRNFATKKGGGSRLGENIFGKNVTLFSDPNDRLVPGSIYSTDGLPALRTVWVENGRLKNLQCGRYWAQKSKRDPVPSPTTLTMAGGETSTADMIKRTKRGLLITRFWYIREVDPQTVLLTGLTRDGVLLIEDGEITRPAQNFRFNESPVTMLNKILAMGPSVRTYGEEGGGFPICVPTLLVEDFNLTSVSDAV